MLGAFKGSLGSYWKIHGNALPFATASLDQTLRRHCLRTGMMMNERTTITRDLPKLRRNLEEFRRVTRPRVS